MTNKIDYEREYNEFLAECLKAGLAKKMSVDELEARLASIVKGGGPFVQRAIQAATDTYRPHGYKSSSVWDGTSRSGMTSRDRPINN